MKRDLPYLITIFILLISFISLVVYFIFINPATKYEFDPNLREDKEFSFVNNNLHKKVDELNDTYTNNELIVDDKIEISRNTALEYKNADTMLYSLYTSSSYLFVNLSLSDNHKIDIVFISSTSKAYKYNIRTIGSTNTKAINYKSLPKGKYRIYINDNDEKYDTMEYVVIE